MNFSFLKQYLFKPRTVGAIAPSSRYLARKMLADVNFTSAELIVEYGPGTGVFTEALLKQRQPNTHVLLIENNEEFYTQLCKKYNGQKNLQIINDTAEHVGNYLDKPADYIISGLPFASLPQQVSENIITQTKKNLKPDGLFITFQYSLLKLGFFKAHFPQISLKREYRNIPPAYVLSCRA